MVELSICIPCFNVEDTLKRCLDSIIVQNFASFEIICVDDCSTDKTNQIIHEYVANDERIKYFRNRFNKGPIESRKKAVLNASGKIIMFTDADDFLSNDALAIVSKRMSEHDVDVLEFDANVYVNNIITNENYCRYFDGSLNNDDIFHYLTKNKLGQMIWNKAYRADLIKKVYSLIPEARLFHKEDVLVSGMMFSRAHTYLGISDKLYNYTKDSGHSRDIVNGSIDKFSERCKMGWVWKHLHNDFASNNHMNEDGVAFLRSKLNSWVRSNVNDLSGFVKTDNLIEAKNAMVRYWKDGGPYANDVLGIQRKTIINTIVKVIETQATSVSSRDALFSLIMSEIGDKKEYLNLARHYRDGNGVSMDLDKSRYWFNKAAENNVEGAERELSDFTNKYGE